jgi:RimJ/RimL family protein N-acetyltransferase
MALRLDPDLPPRLQVRALKPYDRREVKDLCERRVGVGIDNTLDMVFDDNGGVAGIAITEGEAVVGFAVLMFFTPGGVEDYFSVSTEGYPIGEENAMFHAGVVDEYWEGRGLGSELMRLRLALIREAGGGDAAFGKSWLRPDSVDSAVLFEKHGFERIDTIEDAYQWDDGERDCPDCAPEQCSCTGAVYAKVFEEG